MAARKYILALILLCLIALTMGSGSMAAPVDQVSTPAPNITCDQLVQLAEASVGLVCDNLGRNKVCYGNHLVSAQFQPNSKLTFVKSGDTVNLLDVMRLSTAPLNMLTKDWGIAVIKAQANLPDALPGQNVTFLLYGDTTVNNPTPGMNAVTISTRIGNTNCSNVPDSAVLIQSPSGSDVAMTINGASVTLGSTAYITAQQNQEMDVAIVEGQGVVSANGVTQIVQPGAQVGIPLGGGTDGLGVNGPPSAPEPYDLQAIQLAPLKLLDRPVTIPQPIVQSGQLPSSSQGTATPTPQVACTPRTDWQYRYVVQRGDFLSTIALRINMRTADLQAGNCITDPNHLIVGQTLRVPFPIPTNTPPAPTATPTNVQIVGPNLRADNNPINYGDCTTIRWDVDNISQVYFEGQPVIGHDSKQECPSQTTTYTLLVVTKDNQQIPYPITINVNAPRPTDTPTDYIIY
ncbi:MAG TPA: LysM domain-containing protein [Phototrophicaceae bacterium]|nr:LysM domain-containing protein [Phototrophicaceae bacterium]